MTNDEAACQLMVELLRKTGTLDQETAVFQLRKSFGASVTYTNANGNLAITKTVLSLFNKSTAGTVVWSRSERHWRMRGKSDLPGRMQA